jgi:hypothetical protein
MMAKFPYVAWFRDNPQLPPSGETHEWVACFWVEAENKTLALAWGDYLSNSYAARHTSTFYRSYLDDLVEGWNTDDHIPLVQYGLMMK